MAKYLEFKMAITGPTYQSWHEFRIYDDKRIFFFNENLQDWILQNSKAQEIIKYFLKAYDPILYRILFNTGKSKDLVKSLTKLEKCQVHLGKIKEKAGS